MSALGERLAEIDKNLFDDLIEYLQGLGDKTLNKLLEDPQVNWVQIEDRAESQIFSFVRAAQRATIDEVRKAYPDVVTGPVREAWRHEDVVTAGGVALAMAKAFTARLKAQVSNRVQSQVATGIGRSVTGSEVRDPLNGFGGSPATGQGNLERLKIIGLEPVAYSWVLGEPKYPYPEHEKLGGAVVVDPAEWSAYPGDHKGCQCHIAPIFEVNL